MPDSPRTRRLTILAVVWAMGLLTFASVRVFWLGAPDITAAVGSAYVALIGGPLAAAIGWYKWSRSDTNQKEHQK